MNSSEVIYVYQIQLGFSLIYRIIFVCLISFQWSLIILPVTAITFIILVYDKTELKFYCTLWCILTDNKQLAQW